jgi:hypothetical protein
MTLEINAHSNIAISICVLYISEYLRLIADVIKDLIIAKPQKIPNTIASIPSANKPINNLLLLSISLLSGVKGIGSFTLKSFSVLTEKAFPSLLFIMSFNNKSLLPF